MSGTGARACECYNITSLAFRPVSCDHGNMGKKRSEEGESQFDHLTAERAADVREAMDDGRGSDAWLMDDDGRDDQIGTDIEIFDEELDDVEVPKKDQRLAKIGYDLTNEATRHQAAKRAIARAVARKYPNNPLGKYFDPLLFLGLVAASPRVSLDLRVNAAKTVVAYTQPKPPQELHQKIEAEAPIVDRDAIHAKLNDLLDKARAKRDAQEQGLQNADRKDSV